MGKPLPSWVYSATSVTLIVLYWTQVLLTDHNAENSILVTWAILFYIASLVVRK